MRTTKLGKLVSKEAAELCGRSSGSREDSKEASGHQMQTSMVNY